MEQPIILVEERSLTRMLAKVLEVSGFATVWNFLAIVAVLFWVLFYVIP